MRTLERLFLSQFGISPKRLTRIIRLRRLLSLLQRGNFKNLADPAYICGYADQSHMIKDFKEMTGVLPGDIDAGHTGRQEGAPRTRIVHQYRP